MTIGLCRGTKEFWLNVLTDLKNHGLSDIFVACINGLTGFADAIKTVYERTKVQFCVVPLVRAAMRYVTDKDCRPVAADLKKIYNAATLVEAEAELANFAQAWDEKYPTISKSWRTKWPDIITLFDFTVRQSTLCGNQHCAHPPSDLDDQRHRIGQQRDSQVGSQQKGLLERGPRFENHLPGDPRSLQEVDNAHSQMESSPEPLRHPLRKPTASTAVLTTCLQPADTKISTGPLAH